MINPIYRWPCAKVLPLVYDETLSYYESLCKFAKKLNEVIEQLNTINLDEVYKIVDDKIAKANELLNKKMDNLLNQVNDVMDDVNTALENQDKKTEVILANAINKLQISVNDQLNALKSYVMLADNQLLIKWRLEFEEFKNSLPDLNNVYVISPYTGKTVTIQVAIDEIWQYMKQYSLTAYEYDSQQWTADEYDSFKLTAFNYDYYAKRYFYKNPDLYMYSPFTGEYVPVKSVVEVLAEFHRAKDAIDADNYDALELTATIYDGKLISAYNYDWKAKEYLM